jgi:2,3-bisphosphoglycerate-dependent phosphoglycerate mutase
MHKTLYIVRHAKATGQDPDAPLSPEGELQAIRLADQLVGLPLEHILSSPYLRATQSIAPLAQRLDLPIITDERLTERMLGSSDLTDWMTALRTSFDDLDLCFVGGESSRAAMQRAVAVLNDVLAHSARTTVIVTHGNLMTLLLKHFNPEIGFTLWQQLSNPDVYRVELEGGSVTLQRMALADA